MKTFDTHTLPHVLIYGASGHGKVTFDCCRSMGIEVKAFIDDDLKKHGELLGVPVLGSDQVGEENLIYGIGDNAIRKKVAEGFTNPSIVLTNKNSVISDNAILGEGTVAFHNTTIQIDTEIGKHCIINTNASLDHDCYLADYVHIGPNATLCGGVTVDEGTFIGAGSVVIQNVKIGKWVTIGAGSVILKDVPDFAVVVGNPGRIIRYDS